MSRKNSNSNEETAPLGFALPMVTPPSETQQAIDEGAVRLRAYHKWEAAGRPDGDPVFFWLQAERESG